MQRISKVFTLMSAILALAFCLASCKTNADDDPTMYTVTVSSSIEHGKVTADKSSAEAGATIKLTATADSGYELESYSVKDASENELTVTDGTFTMPESNVTVSATFKEKSSGGTGTGGTTTTGGGTTGSGTTSGGTEKQAGSISYTTASISKTTADTAFTNELTKTGDGTVTYSSSKETVATVNATTGEVNIKGAGKTTITATVADSETYTYATKTATYTITVTAAAAATKTLTLTGVVDYVDFTTDEPEPTEAEKSLEIEYTDNDTWKDIAERYDEVSLKDSTYGPSEGKVVMFWYDESQYSRGCQLKSNESTYNYYFVSINDKVSAYSSDSYYLE